MAKYVGVTIGPIFDTMQLAESPAALWYSSAIFSKLTECILQKIKEKIDDAEIFSPFYNPEAEYTDGIGRYHDRVIFKTEKTELTAAAVDEAEEKVIAIILKDAGIAGEKDSIHALPGYDFLKKYFRIHTVFLDEEKVGETNAILKINPLLDALEQMYVFNTEGSANPIKALFSKNEAALNESRNAKIKNSLLLRNVVDSQLYKNKTLKSIEDICGKFDGLKKHKYFAIVSADGDGMGEFLSKTKNEDINNFSGDCFTYAEKASKKIAEYGGMTVYAGGDDLLFLAPVEGKGERSSRSVMKYQICSKPLLQKIMLLRQFLSVYQSVIADFRFMRR